MSLQETRNHYFLNKFIEIKQERNKINLEDHLKFYTGHLVDEPDDSEVNGAFIGSLFIGTIKSFQHGKFYIEPIRRYRKLDETGTIIYHEDDIDFSVFESNKTPNESTILTQNKSMGCGTSFNKINSWLETNHKKTENFEVNFFKK